jgi:hypothetical protein
MYGINELNRMNRPRRGWPITAKWDGDQEVRNIPFIGERKVRGWTEVNRYFVDSSGFGRAGEPALTADQFFRKVRKDFAYAIVEQGQFQMYIAEFQKNSTLKG